MFRAYLYNESPGSEWWLTEFLYLRLQVHDFLEHLSGSLTGSDLPHITGTSLADFSFALPPLDEQGEIARRVEALFGLADAIERRVEAATKQADALTQSILALAFRGELVPTEAELACHEGRDYEPASALLERIRNTRSVDTGTRKGWPPLCTPDLAPGDE